MCVYIYIYVVTYISQSVFRGVLTYLRDLGEVCYSSEILILGMTMWLVICHGFAFFTVALRVMVPNMPVQKTQSR